MKIVGIKTAVLATANIVLSPYLEISRKNLKNKTKTLILTKKIPLSKKLDLLSNNRLTNFWDVITDTNTSHLKNREEYKIVNIKEHILKFDPAGTSTGCGCLACQMNHKVYLLEQKHKKAVFLNKTINNIDKLIRSNAPTNRIIEIIDNNSKIFPTEINLLKSIVYSGKIHFENTLSTLVKKTTVNLPKFKKSYQEWINSIYSYVNTMEIETSSDLYNWKSKLLDLCNFCNIPIKEKNQKSVNDSFNKFKRKKFLRNLPINEKERLLMLEELDIYKYLIPIANKIPLQSFKKRKLEEYLVSLEKAMSILLKNNVDGEYDKKITNLKKRFNNEKIKLINIINQHFVFSSLM